MTTQNTSPPDSL